VRLSFKLTVAAFAAVSALVTQRALALTTCTDSVVPSQACVLQGQIQRQCCIPGFPINKEHKCTTTQYNGIAAAYWTARTGCEEPTDECTPFTKSCP
jgi:hypothetical protein